MKTLKQILCSICLICSLVIFWACDEEEATITEIYIQPNSITTEIEQFAEWSTEDIIVKAKYSNGDEKVVTDVTFSSIDTQILGEQTLTATYGEFTCQITITVIEFTGERAYYITAIKTPEFITSYKNNSTTENTYTDQLASNANETTKGFINLNQDYKVGDDNPFKFSPSISVEYFDITKDPEDINNYPIHADVYLYNQTNETYELISENDLNNYVAINANAHTFDFTELAINKKFKISVRPDFDLIIGEDEYTSDSSVVISNNTFKTIDFEFTVVDGWNAYTATDLSLIDNSNDESKWTELKTANGLLNTTTDAIILHNNIEITPSDIPSIHFYSDTNTDGYEGSDLESLKGYMTNWDNYVAKGIIYKRVIEDGESFNIEGNYFTVSIENLPLVKDIIPEGDVLEVYTTLFGFIDENTEHRYLPESQHTAIKIGAVDTNEESCTINNLSLMGNSNKNETTGQAGLVCYKTENVNFTMDNCLSQAWYIAHYLEGSSETGNGVTHTLKNCTTFDSYNSLMYIQAARNVILENCIMIGAGGPVMICDEEVDTYDFNADNDSEDENEYHSYLTNVTTTNCNLQSWIMGRESWFIQYKAETLIGQIKALNDTIKKSLAAGGIGMTMLDSSGDKLNIVAVYKSSSVTDPTTFASVNGTFKTAEHSYGLDFANNSYANQGQHVLQTFTGALIPTSGTQVALGYTPQGTTQEEITQNYTNELISRIISADKYLAAYLANGMGVVFGASKS